MQETKEKEHEERNCEKIDVCRKVSLKMRNGIILGAGKRSGNVESKESMHHHFALTTVEATKKNIKKLPSICMLSVDLEF
jgi:hypothetical protein